ncbi:toll/interleukin-1 receptor domain-containing protein [Bradyrhizobium elkanii]|uniref:toll/interleukin-1 receptor domain-containing protein n=1 Tax=Bradyrhizobium elkanii TaxID=29448 RepID=UPI003D227C32
MRKLKIFVSYSHADARARPGFNVSRLGRIMEELKYDLGCHSDRSRFEVLRDVEMTHVSDNFRVEIDRAITACDVAILFISEEFSRSEECEAEFARLIDLGKPLFLVEIEPILLSDEEDRIRNHRKAVKDTIFVRFWGPDNNQKSVKYGYPFPDNTATRDKYDEALGQVVAGLKARVLTLPQAGNGQEVRPNDQPDQNRVAIFVACPAADVKPEAQRLATTMEAKKFVVRAFDPELDVRKDDTFSGAFSRALAQCDAYVQLLGASPGKPVAGSELRLVRAQYDLARQAGKPAFIWRAAGFDVDDLEASYGAFLKGITDCQIGNFVEFEDYLMKKLDDLAALRRSDERRAAKSQGRNAALPFVVIDAARPDSELAQKIADALADHVNVDHLDYDLTGQMLADAVVDNNALIFAYGKSVEGQKRTQAHFRLIRRPTGELNVSQLELAVGNGAPPTALPFPRGPNVHVITVTDEVDTVEISNFLAKLGVVVEKREAQ